MAPEDMPEIAGGIDPARSSSAMSDLRAVRAALEELDELSRSIVILREVEGMTYQEIGDLMGLSAAAIRKRVGGFRRAVQNNPPAWLSELED